MQWLIDRLKEPSTYQGLVMLVAAVGGPMLAPEQLEQVGAGAVAVIGVIQTVKQG